ERPPGGEDPAQVGAQPERGSEQSPGLCLPGTCEGRRDQAPAARLGGGRDERAQLAGRAREQAEREPSAQLRIGNRGAGKPSAEPKTSSSTGRRIQPLAPAAGSLGTQTGTAQSWRGPQRSSRGTWTQARVTQRSSVHAIPSSHAVSSRQQPGSGVPMQTLAWQPSAIVQSFPSSQAAPSNFTGFEQVPVAGL